MCGIIVIGRNEGDRLTNCLSIIARQDSTIVYVDSASDDDSVCRAKSFGIEVIELSQDQPMSAARARNAGFEHLLAVSPDTRYVQFIDGDCELNASWIELAVQFLDENADVAIATGRRREKHPDFSIFNELCDAEWGKELGPIESSGGDFMCRASAFREVSGFDESLLAGEDPEFCYRIKRSGAGIVRLDCDMTLHDINITSYSQWARRSMRTGYAYAAMANAHINDGAGFRWRANVSMIVWGFLLPVMILGGALFGNGYFSLLWLLYPIQYGRIWIRMLRKKASPHPAIHALFVLSGKFLGFAGQIRFLKDRIGVAAPELVEYK